MKKAKHSEILEFITKRNYAEALFLKNLEEFEIYETINEEDLNEIIDKSNDKITFLEKNKLKNELKEFIVTIGKRFEK